MKQKQERFMELYDPLHARLSRFVQSQVWNREEAKDIVSETALTAYEQFEKLKEDDRFLYYLFTIASRLIKKRFRRQKFFGVFIPEKAEQIQSDADTDAEMLRRELNKAMAKLPEKQREAVALFEISGFSIREIAAMQHTGEPGVKSNLKRGRERLAKLLAEMKRPGSGTTPAARMERRQYGR